MINLICILKQSFVYFTSCIRKKYNIDISHNIDIQYLNKCIINFETRIRRWFTSLSDDDKHQIFERANGKKSIKISNKRNAIRTIVLVFLKVRLFSSNQQKRQRPKCWNFYFWFLPPSFSWVLMKRYDSKTMRLKHTKILYYSDLT